jgi:hypothetical protein
MDIESRLKDLYRTGVTQALAGFQLIEEGLKTYLGIYFDSIRLLIGDRLHFGFAKEDYQDAALGRLITIFAKTSSNAELLSQLRSVTRQRDHIAHQALLKLYPEKPISVDEYKGMLEEIDQMITKSEALHAAISSEMQKVVSALDSK